jgi:hypothetical protein
MPGRIQAAFIGVVAAVFDHKPEMVQGLVMA